MSELFLVVGLGNPGPRYTVNRHNVGFLVVETLAQRAHATFKSHKSQVLLAEVRLGALPGHRVVLAKPLSFMNLSGGPTASLAAFFKVPPEHIIVVHDELDIPFGTVRLKQGGGDNGHNGLRSITKSLSTPEYVRVRVGIGRPPGQQNAADFVLSDFARSEQSDAEVLIERAADAVEALVASDLVTAQNVFNGQ